MKKEKRELTELEDAEEATRKQKAMADAWVLLIVILLLSFLQEAYSYFSNSIP